MEEFGLLVHVLMSAWRIEMVGMKFGLAALLRLDVQFVVLGVEGCQDLARRHAVAPVDIHGLDGATDSKTECGCICSDDRPRITSDIATRWLRYVIGFDGADTFDLLLRRLFTPSRRNRSNGQCDRLNYAECSFHDLSKWQAFIGLAKTNRGLALT